MRLFFAGGKDFVSEHVFDMGRVPPARRSLEPLDAVAETELDVAGEAELDPAASAGFAASSVASFAAGAACAWARLGRPNARPIEWALAL